MNSNPFSEFNQMTISWKRRGGEGRRKEEEGGGRSVGVVGQIPGIARHVPSSRILAKCANRVTRGVMQMRCQETDRNEKKESDDDTMKRWS